MRPRGIPRGKRPGPRRAGVTRRAPSMRPRGIPRGKPHELEKLNRLSLAFNEAAGNTPRKTNAVAVVVGGIIAFNEAAGNTPRKTARESRYSTLDD